jgi:hypothetical protein
METSNEQKMAEQMETTADAAKTVQDLQQMPILDKSPQTVKVDENTAFQLRLLQFDKEITEAKLKVADLENQKMQFSFDRNMQIVIANSQQNLLKEQIETETRKRLQEQTTKK